MARVDKELCFGSQAKRAKDAIHQTHGITPVAPRNFEAARAVYQTDVKGYQKASSEFEAMMNETHMMDASTTNAVEHYMMKAETLQV